MALKLLLKDNFNVGSKFSTNFFDYVGFVRGIGQRQLLIRGNFNISLEFNKII